MHPKPPPRFSFLLCLVLVLYDRCPIVVFVPGALINGETSPSATEMVLVLNINNNETLFVLHLSLFTLVPFKHTSERRFLTQTGGIDFSLGYFYKVPPGCKATKYAFNLFCFLFFFALSCTLCEIKRENGG